MLDLILGLLGMALILTAFILEEFLKKFNPNTIKFNLLNLFGSLLMSYYAYTISDWPFLVLNLVWFCTAGYKLSKLLKK